ncbi:hypothetical protein [Marinomonas sp. 2405UD68-3]|uniref:hypothetical protein n=1 Tax=Marinomonas sp. 2405UD68-3 TaxID=3391835 RepID=UPI0039C9D444
MISSTRVNVEDQYSRFDKGTKLNTSNQEGNTLPASEKATSLPAIDKITISDTAIKALEKDQNNSPKGYYEQFIPTYEGFSSKNLAFGVKEPGMETFSAGKELAQVITDARASLDKNYQKLKSIGKPHLVGHSSPESRNSLFGELDRRALNAIVNDKQGTFTKYEQDIARNKMSQQQGLAMGLYNGPISEESKFVDPFLGNKTEQFKAGVQFLDKVGNEEKATIEYAFQRAGVQRSYENLSREQGEIPEDFTSEHPLLILILQARESANGDFNRGFTTGSIRDTDDLKSQPWFEGFESKLDNAIKATEDLFFPKEQIV